MTGMVVLSGVAAVSVTGAPGRRPGEGLVGSLTGDGVSCDPNQVTRRRQITRIALQREPPRRKPLVLHLHRRDSTVARLLPPRRATVARGHRRPAKHRNCPAAIPVRV